ncbi:RpiB/LacA/LacB family sugar-phosphate isomerase [bacterium]|nr:RpiB/LacA/LacB family sugar-phosphate isomerase [bacterium]
MTKKKLITERDVRKTWQKKTELQLFADSILTPLAKDAIKELKIKVSTFDSAVLTAENEFSQADELAKITTPASLKEVNIDWGKIALGSDHGGFLLKEFLKGILTSEGYKILDFGTNSTEAVDYPDFADLSILLILKFCCCLFLDRS